MTKTTLEQIEKPTKSAYEKQLLNLKDNSSLYMETINQYHNYLITSKDYDYLISLLEKVLNETIIQEQTQRLEIINKLVSVLLKIEDFKKLKSALDLREELITKESDQILQKFYYAVCYEGLEDNLKAIETLMAIKDTISNQNLVNKYLKLSMLNLKVNDFESANKYYQKAFHYDLNKKNTTFLLAECDLLIYQKNYLKALEVYESYYIKTNNKYRYLDRYIEIQMHLNQLAEAYSFYEKHLEVMSKVLSKQSRIKYYEAGIKLMKRLRNHQEESRLKLALSEIQESMIPLHNLNNFILHFLDNNYDKTFIKRRDILHNIFMETAKYQVFSKMTLLDLQDRNPILFHYSKRLLLEKEITNENESDSIFKAIINQNYQRNYDKESLTNFKDDVFVNSLTENIFIGEISEYEYLVFYTENRLYQSNKDFFDLIVVVIKKLFNDYDKHGMNYRLMETIIKVLDQQNQALILLQDNTFHLLNSSAKILLETEADYLSYEKFQSFLVKNVYPDELLKLKDINIKYQGSYLKNINFQIIVNDLDIFLFGKEVIIEKKIAKYELIDSIYKTTVKGDATLLLFNLRGYHELLKDYSFYPYEKFIDKFIEIVRISSRNYWLNAYLEGLDNIYVLLTTKDKRIIKRVVDEALEKVYSTYDLRVSSISLKNEICVDDIIDLKYLIAISNNQERYVIDNKHFRINKEVSKTILLNTKKMLTDKQVKLAFHQVVNWQNHSFSFIYVDVLEKALLGDKESLKRIIRANELENDWDQLVLNQLIKDIRLSGFSYRFIIDVSPVILEDEKIINKFKKRLQDKLQKDFDLIFVVDFNDLDRLLKKPLKKENLAISNISYDLKVNEIDLLAGFKYLFIENNEVLSTNCDYLFKIAKDYNLEIIFNHGKANLTKSFLQDKGITFVLGEAFRSVDNLGKFREKEVN